jgi:hypothetical protein
MKKSLLFLVVLAITSLPVFAQDSDVSKMVTTCVELMEKPVPKSYTKLAVHSFNDPDHLDSTGSIYVWSDVHGIVFQVFRVNTFQTLSDASHFLGLVCRRFELDGWKHLKNKKGHDFYGKNNIQVFVMSPTQEAACVSVGLVFSELKLSGL